MDRILLVHTASTTASNGLYRGDLPFGAPEELSLDAFEECGIEKIRESFASFSLRTGDPDSDVGSFTKKQWTALLRDHRVVAVSLQESGMWHLAPVYHIRLGVSGGSRPEDSSQWHPGGNPRMFFRLLWLSFGLADLPRKKNV